MAERFLTPKGEPPWPMTRATKDRRTRASVNLTEDYEVRYWTQKFGVSKSELEKAVAKAGQSAAAVAKALGKTL